MPHHHCKKECKCSKCCALVVVPPPHEVHYAEFHFTLPTTTSTTPLDMSDPIQNRLHTCLHGVASSGGNVSFTNWITDPTRDITLCPTDPTSVLIKEGGVYRFHFQADVSIPGPITFIAGFILALFLNGTLVQPSQYLDILSQQFPGVDPFSNPTVSLGLRVPPNSKVGLFIFEGTGVNITARTSIFDIVKIRD